MRKQPSPVLCVSESFINALDDLNQAAANISIAQPRHMTEAAKRLEDARSKVMEMLDEAITESLKRK